MASDKKRERIEKEQELKNQIHLIESNRAYVAQSEKRLAQIDSDYRRQLHGERNEVPGQAEKLAQEVAKQAHRQSNCWNSRQRRTAWSRIWRRTPAAPWCSRERVLLTLVPKEETCAPPRSLGEQRGHRLRAPGPAGEAQVRRFPFQKYGMVEGNRRARQCRLGRFLPKKNIISSIMHSTITTIEEECLPTVLEGETNAAKGCYAEKFPLLCG
jgi:hemolysin D